MIAPPTTAMITAITTIPIVSIVFTPSALIRQDAGGAYSLRTALLQCTTSTVDHANVR